MTEDLIELINEAIGDYSAWDKTLGHMILARLREQQEEIDDLNIIVDSLIGTGMC